MALLFMDSFDNYATADFGEKYSYVHPGYNYDNTAILANGRHGSNGLRMGQINGFANSKALAKTLVPSDNTIIVGMAFASITTFTSAGIGTDPWNGNNSVLLLVRNAGVDQCWVRLNSDGTLSVMRGTTIVRTTPVGLQQAQYTFVEILLTIHDTQGVIWIRFNGATVLNVPNQNTRNGTVNAWSEFRLGWAASGSTIEWNFDDLYVLDGSGAAPCNAFLGDCRVDARFPTGPGATTGWTPSTGANWQCVNTAVPNDDTDYVLSPGGPLVTDTFAVQDLPVAGALVYGVQHCISARKVDSGTGAIAPVIRHAGVDRVGTDLTLGGGGYTYGLQVAQVNPGTGLQWTETDFNAAEFGYKRVS